MIDEGKVMDALASKEAWEGYEGKSAKILQHLESASSSLNTAITDNLVVGSLSSSLATKMAIRSQAFHTKFKGYAPIANAFLRFLTSQAGANTSAGLAAKIKAVEEKLKKEVATLVSKTDGAVRNATAAQTFATRLMNKNGLKHPDKKVQE